MFFGRTAWKADARIQAFIRSHNLATERDFRHISTGAFQAILKKRARR